MDEWIKTCGINKHGILLSSKNERNPVIWDNIKSLEDIMPGETSLPSSLSTLFHPSEQYGQLHRPWLGLLSLSPDFLAQSD